MTYVYISEINDIKSGFFTTAELAARDIAVTACHEEDVYETSVAVVSDMMPEGIAARLQLPEIIRDLYITERMREKKDARVHDWRVVRHELDQAPGEYKRDEHLFSAFRMKYGGNLDWIVTRFLLDHTTGLKNEQEARDAITLHLEYQQLSNRSLNTNFMIPDSAIAREIAQLLPSGEVDLEEAKSACIAVFDQFMNNANTPQP